MSGGDLPQCRQEGVKFGGKVGCAAATGFDSVPRPPVIGRSTALARGSRDHDKGDPRGSGKTASGTGGETGGEYESHNRATTCNSLPRRSTKVAVEKRTPA